MGFSITEENIAKPKPKRTPFGPGIYRFTVGKAELRSSEAGNRYLRINLLVDHEGFNFKLFDQLMFVDEDWATEKYARVLQCLGISPLEHPSQDTEEEADALKDELLGRAGTVRIRKEKDSDYCEPAWYFLEEEAELEELGPFPVKAKSASSLSEKEKVGDVPF